jgi:hypothetical protein
MAGRLGHIDDARRVGHIPRNKIRKTEYAYGFGGVLFWLDASYGLNTSTNLGAVSIWNDRVSNWSFIQSTAGNQPRLITSNASFNNYPTIDFYTTARFMDSNRGGLPLSKSTTLIFVAKYDTINGRNAVLANSTNSGTIGLGGTGVGANGVYYSDVATGNIIASGTTNSTTTKIVVMTNSQIVVNGTQEYSGTISLFPDWSCDRLARRAAFTANQLLGHIAEIIFLDAKLTSEECLRISDNINSKYAIY